MLCTDGSKALAGAARKLGLTNHVVNLSASVRVDSARHVQSTHAYNNTLKSYIYKLRDVATCYLENYFCWFCALDREPIGGPNKAQWLSMALNNLGYNMVSEHSLDDCVRILIKYLIEVEDTVG